MMLILTWLVIGLACDILLFVIFGPPDPEGRV